MRTTLCRLLVAAVLLSPATAVGQTSIRGIALDEALAGSVIVGAAAPASGIDLSFVRVRLIVERADVERRGTLDFTALDARLSQYERLRTALPLIDLRHDLAATQTFEPWADLLRVIAERYRGRVGAYIIGIGPVLATAPPRESGFFIKRAVVSLRGGDPQASVVLGGIDGANGDRLTALLQEDIAPYVNTFGVTTGSENLSILDIIERRLPQAGVVLLGEPAAVDGTEPALHVLRRTLHMLGTRVAGLTFDVPPAAAAATLQALSSLGDLLSQDLVTLDAGALGLRLTRGTLDVTAGTPYKFLFGTVSLSNYLILEPGDAVTLTVGDPKGVRPIVRDVARRTRETVSDFEHDAALARSRMSVPSHTFPLVVDWNTGAATTTSMQERVVASLQLTAAEIISRHQAAQARQDAALQTYVADVAMEQHFRTSASEPGFDVVTQNRFYVDKSLTEWEELEFRLNGTRWGANRPPLPMLQTEKVLSLPLDLRLNTDYRYSLEGTDTVGDRICFKLRFDPIDETRSFYRGSVWIDGQTYLKVKVQTVQSVLVAPIISSEEVQYFSSVGSIANQDVQLLTHLVNRQLVLIAGRSVLVERDARFTGFALNPHDFEARRDAARSSDRVMYRDTDKGLRHLVKEDGVRRVLDEVTASATAAMVGVTYDPSYDFPLPLAGINYLNFKFLGENNQLAVLFAGVLALVNVQRPNLIGASVDGSLDLFAIAVRNNDRTYDVDGEIPGTRLRRLPFSTGVNLGWRAAEFHRLGLSYQFQFDDFRRDPDTAADFIVPTSTVTNGLGVSWEWKQAGFSFVTMGTAYKRLQWREWGTDGDYRTGDSSYVKYSSSLSRDWVSGFHKVYLNAAYFGGRRLDRFSSYQFGFFDANRIHGVPSSGVRFGELAMLRGSYSFNLLDLYRLDLSVHQAWGRAPSRLADWQRVTGLGLGFTMRGPKNTLIRGDLGKSFLPARYQKPGSVVLQIQVLKPL